MKNKFSGKKFSTFLSIIAAIAVAVLFWLVVKYIDANSLTAFFSSDMLGGVV